MWKTQMKPYIDFKVQFFQSPLPLYPHHNVCPVGSMQQFQKIEKQIKPAGMILSILRDTPAAELDS